MDLRQIAEALAVPMGYLTGRKEKPKLKVIKGGKDRKPEKSNA